MQQSTDEWFQARLGKVTASRMADVMRYLKDKSPAAARTNYMYENLVERLTGEPQDGGFTSAAMQRGIDLEPVARMAYWMTTGREVSQCGLVHHARIRNFAASPDGLVRKTGLIEIKCPNSSTHFQFLRTGEINPDYLWQMHAQMACTGRKWCDFVSFDDRYPEHLQIGIKRVHRDPMVLHSLQKEVRLFLSQLGELEKQAKKLRPIKAPISRLAA